MRTDSRDFFGSKAFIRRQFGRFKAVKVEALYFLGHPQLIGKIGANIQPGFTVRIIMQLFSARAGKAWQFLDHS
jgi:hypothetical protein